MEFTKKTIVVRESHYERLRRDAFFSHRDIKDVLDEILAEWIEANPEKPRANVRPLNESRQALEVEQIREAMAQAGNNREQAARRLNISRMALFQKCRKYGLSFPASGRPGHVRKG